MAALRQYGLVRVVQLLSPPESYDGWRVNRRPQQVGDIGTLVDIVHAPGLADKYVVEASGSDGVAICLADFDAEQLEPMV
jgi:hypothetical protein